MADALTFTAKSLGFIEFSHIYYTHACYIRQPYLPGEIRSVEPPGVQVMNTFLRNMVHLSLKGIFIIYYASLRPRVAVGFFRGGNFSNLWVGYASSASMHRLRWTVSCISYMPILQTPIPHARNTLTG